MNLELSNLIIWVALLTVNICFEIQVYNYVQSSQRYDKMSKFLHDNNDDNADAKAIAICGFSPKTAKLKIKNTSLT